MMRDLDGNQLLQPYFKSRIFKSSKYTKFCEYLIDKMFLQSYYLYKALKMKLCAWNYRKWDLWVEFLKIVDWKKMYEKISGYGEIEIRFWFKYPDLSLTCYTNRSI